jgi:glycosyltransferase involved in cell wall biosynthesis
MPLISAVIITKNEEKNIGRCLDSLAGVADDVVVVDDFSTDGTERICREKGARYVQHAFQGHIEQKNWAITQARHPHVLSLDADEALSDTLKRSVLKAREDWAYDGYSMNRLTSYCGQWVRRCGWYPDRKLRLFDSRKGRWGGTNPHDRYTFHTPGSTEGFLNGDLLHFSYRTPEQFLQRQRQYAALGARALKKRNAKAGWLHLYMKPGIRFIRDYLIKGGLLEGRAGWVISLTMARAVFWKYAELRKLNRAG